MDKLNKELTIGRGKDNLIRISNQSISTKHCTLERLGKDSFLIIDCGSTNGTRINGRRVRRKIISQKDEIVLGNYKLLLTKIYKPPPPDYTQRFQNLKGIWETYQEAINKVKNRDTLKKTWIRGGLALIPFVGHAIGIVATGHINPTEKLQVLRNEFKTAYLCPNPKCHQFLGEMPFETLEKQGKCRFCKVLWK